MAALDNYYQIDQVNESIPDPSNHAVKLWGNCSTVMRNMHCSVKLFHKNNTIALHLDCFGQVTRQAHVCA